MKKQHSYSEAYFDSGQAAIGSYSSYEIERFDSAFKAIVSELRKNVTGNRVLDIGCAKGFLVLQLRKAGFESYGMDISKYAINEASDSIRDYLHVVDLNSGVIPIENEWIDAIICMGTLEYIANQQHALEEIGRVLKPGGYIFVTTLNSVTADDHLRRFAKNREAWDLHFASIGFIACHKKAEAIFIPYIRSITKYDFEKYINGEDTEKGKELFKKHMLRFAYKTFFSEALRRYLCKKQIKSGYSMLCYQKKTSK